jgi:hypothetical protein
MNGMFVCIPPNILNIFELFDSIIMIINDNINVYI